MPNKKSAEKEIRSSARKNLVNRMTESKVRTAKKKALEAIKDSNDEGSVKDLIVKFESLINSAVNKSVFHWKTAARHVSRLNHQFKVKFQPEFAAKKAK